MSSNVDSKAAAGPFEGETNEDTLLEVETLRTTFYTDKETIRAVDGISFDIARGETVALVGESGSGKSVTARSIMGLVDSPGQVHTDSSIKYRDLPTVKRYAKDFEKHTVDLTESEAVQQSQDHLETRADVIEYLADEDDFVFVEEREPQTDGPDGITAGYIDISRASEEGLRRVRGDGIAMIFQDPLTSLNPVYTVGNQIKEALSLHQGITGAEATEEAISLLEAVGIPDAPRRIEEYPHQFSGGMRQRAVIAVALACDPELIIADEPTTALDVTIQAQILALLEDLQETRDLGMLFITHDMGVIAQIADRVNVMYAGEIVESAPVVELFENPQHPYTRGLLESIPGRQVGAERLATIEGDVPTPTEAPTYCRFAPRCDRAFDACQSVHPKPIDVSSGPEEHRAACLLYPEDLSQEEAVALHRDGETKHAKDGGDAAEDKR